MTLEQYVGYVLIIASFSIIATTFIIKHQANKHSN